MIATFLWSFNIEFLLEVNYLSKHVLFGIGLNLFYSSITPPKHRPTPQLTFPKHHNNPHIANTLQQMFVNLNTTSISTMFLSFHVNVFFLVIFCTKISFLKKLQVLFPNFQLLEFFLKMFISFLHPPSFTFPTFTCISTLLVPSSFFSYHFSFKLFTNSFELFQI